MRKKITRIATMRPNLVVINASEMPPESVLTSPDPNTVINLNVLMMPVTVPSRPSIGAIEPMSER